VADIESLGTKLQEFADTGPKLFEFIGVVRVAGLAGSKQAAQPTAHKQIANDGLATVQHQRN
jgi:hypothetical protein